MFSNESNLTYSELQSVGQDKNNNIILKETNLSVLDSIRYVVNRENTNTVKVEIYTDFEDITYYVGLTPLEGIYTYSNEFTFQPSEIDYYVSIKYNGIIIILNKIKLL